MIYNLGTTVPLSWSNGTDLGPATLTVTGPDGTVTSTPNITTTGGVYTGTFTPPAFGLFTVLWQAGSGAAEGSYQDVFEVRPDAPVALISLDDAREALRLRSTDTADNAKIQRLIEGASILILDITGPMTSQEYTEWFDGGVETVSPSYQPLTRVVAAAEYYGLSKFVLTEQPLGSQTDAFAFTVDYFTGQIMRRTYGGAPAMFAIGGKNVEITYQAGRPYVPENVQIACGELVRHFYTHTQPPGRTKYGTASGDDGPDQVSIGYAIPNFVLEMIQPTRRAPGIA